MHYMVLKSIIDTMIKNFSCRECEHHIQEEDVRVHGIKDEALQLVVICPECKSQTHMKAEVKMMRQAHAHAHAQPKKQSQISDKDIVELQKELQDHPSVQDLLN